MMGLKIGVKFSVCFAVMILLIFILGGNSFVSLNASKSELKEINNSTERLVMVLKIRNEYEKNISDMRGLIGYKDEGFYEEIEKNMRNALAMENQLLKITGPGRREEVQQLIALTNTFVNELTDQILPVIKLYLIEAQQGNYELAEDRFQKVLQVNSELVPLEEQIFVTVNNLIEAEEHTVSSELALAEKDADRIIMLAQVITLSAILIGIFLSVTLTRGICRPLLEMVRCTNKFADGDFSDPVAVKTKGELGILAGSLNRMQASFREVIRKLNLSSAQLADAAAHLADQARYTSSGASETAMAMNEITAGTDRINNNLNRVSSRAGIAAEHAGRGARGIELIREQMREISAASAQASGTVESLGEAIGKVVQFIEIIKNISEQTNLLALNATIEAARAGNAGKGFAVVAEEIRGLAERSAYAAKEIGSLIHEMEGRSKLAVQSMRSGGEKVEQGSHVINEVGDNFSQIIGTVRALSGQVQNIVQSAQQVFAGVQNVAGTAEEQTAAMDEVYAASDKLNNLAAELNTLVLKFKF